MLPGSSTSGSPQLVELQRYWWLIGIGVSMVGAFGFQASSPSRRLTTMERSLRTQDSLLAAHVTQERLALDSINRQVGQLLAGQCIKERDRMARVLYACADRLRREGRE